MKKTISLLSGILIAIFIILSLLDKSEYAVEKRLWKIQMDFTQLIRDPKIVPEKKYDEVVHEYQQVIKQFPRSKLTPGIYLQIGRVYVLKRDYSKARESFQEIIQRYSDKPTLCAIALLNIGRTYGEEKNKAEALKVLNDVINTYPTTPVGLNTPLYIANYYRKLNDMDGSKSALRDAATFYKKISSENPDSMIEFDALRLLAATHLAQKNWEECVQVLGDALLKFSSSKYLTRARAGLIINSINTVSILQLKDFDRPAKIYQQIIDKDPSQPLSHYLVAVVHGLEQLKKQSTTTIKKNE